LGIVAEFAETVRLAKLLPAPQSRPLIRRRQREAASIAAVWEGRIVIIFTARKKKLCIAFLVLAGLVSIGIGVTRWAFPHRAGPIVLGGALIAVSAYVVTIDPGEYPRRRRRRH
jgi:hypothetical protein